MKNTSRSSCWDIAAVPPLPKLLVILLLLLSSIEMVVDGLPARKLLLSPPLQDDESVLRSEQEVPSLKIRIVTAKQGMVSKRKILLLDQNKTISNSEQEKSSLKTYTGNGSSSTVMPAKQGMVSKRRIPPSNSNPTQNKSKPRFSGSRNP